MKSSLKILSGFLFIFLFNSGCVHSQEEQNKTQKSQPKVDIKVNRHYDDKGNVVGYDSTYSYSYSDSAKAGFNDSIFKSFPGIHNFSFHSFNGLPSFPDSLLNGNMFKNNPFFNDPFFNQNFGNNFSDPFKEMEKILKNLDSLRNKPIIPAPKAEPDKSLPKNKHKQLQVKPEEYKSKEKEPEII